MKALLAVVIVSIVVGITYVVLKIRENISQSHVRKAPDLFTLAPGKVTRDLKWELDAGKNPGSPINSIVSCLQAHGARVLRQEDEQVALSIGSRIAIKISGNWPQDPLKTPLRVLARTEKTTDNAGTIRVRLDEDFGGQLVLRLEKHEFEAAYNRAFDVITQILEKELGSKSTTGGG